MTPEQIAAVNAILGILKIVSSWPVGSVIGAIVMGPWILVVFLSRAADKRDQANERRFDAVKQMYEKNVELVRDSHGLSDDLKDIVIMNTQESQKTRSEVEKARDDIKNNRFCPVMRVENKKTAGAAG